MAPLIVKMPPRGSMWTTLGNPALDTICDLFLKLLYTILTTFINQSGARSGNQMFFEAQPISARLRGAATSQDPHADGG